MFVAAADLLKTTFALVAVSCVMQVCQPSTEQTELRRPVAQI